MDCAIKRRCEQCGQASTSSTGGRRKKFCSDACRQAAFRYETGQSGTRGRAALSRNESASQVIEIIDSKIAESAISKNGHPRFVKVNDCTIKMIDGSTIRQPGSHGQWPASNTEKALAWIIGIGRGYWIARCKDRSSKPMPLAKAKAAAMQMITDPSAGRVIDCPISRLTILHAAIESMNERQRA